MNENISDETWKISDSSLEIQSALKDIYDDLVKQASLFPNNYSLFCSGLVYGLLHNKQHDVKPNASFIKLFAINDRMSRDVIDLVFRVLDDGAENSKTWQKMLSFADGGVLALNEIYRSNKNFRIPHLLEEAKTLWPQRIKELHNINFKKFVAI